MHPAEIQCELKKRGFTQKQLALEYGCSEMSISHEVNGIPVSEQIRKFIAKKIDRDPKRVFYDYYFGPKPKGRSGELNLEKVNDALDRTGGNKEEAAKLLGVSRATFYSFLSKNRKAA